MSEQLKKVKNLVELRQKARLGGGETAIEKQHAKGKATARERIDLLLDKGSFEEMDMFKLHRCHNFGMEKKQFLGDGVVCGSGTINGRLVYVYAQDFTVNGGSLSETMAEKICKVMDQSMKMGAPCIGLNDSGGARIQEGINALAGFGNIFQRNIEASGVVPQISGICGPCAGGAVYSPALTDFVVMLEGVSYMFLTGPKVVKTVTGEDVTQEDLGGATVHSTKSGVCHFTAKSEEEFAALIRRLLSYIPQNNMERAPRVPCNDPIDRKEDSLNEIIPDNPNMAYDMYKVIGAVVDGGEFLEVQRNFARNIIIGFARFNGQSVGIVANQPSVSPACSTATPAARLPASCASATLQHTHRDARRRARIPPRHRPGIQRRHRPRRQAPLRLRRGHRAQGNRHPAQELRRQPHRNGMQTAQSRPQLRMALGRNRRHGRQRSRGHTQRQRGQEPGRSQSLPRTKGKGIQRPLHQSL